MVHLNLEYYQFIVTIEMVVSGKVCKNAGRAMSNKLKNERRFQMINGVEWAITIHGMARVASLVVSRHFNGTSFFGLLWFSTIPHMGLLELSID